VNLVAAMRRLGRRHLLLLAALILACLVGVVIPYRIGFPPSLRSRQYQVGIASASALVDSTRSQLADLGADTGSDVGTLAYRASLLASLVTSSPIKDEIAQRAGVPANDLIATGPATVVGSDSPAPSVSNAPINESGPTASTLSVSVPTLPAGQIPVIQVNTQGPSPAIAASLANAAFAALQAEVNSVAGTDRIPALQRVVIRPLGPADAALASRGPGLLYGILGAVLTFVLACGAILGITSLRAAWRNESALERGVLDPSEGSLEPCADDEPIRAGQVELPIDSAEGDPVTGDEVDDPLIDDGADDPAIDDENDPHIDDEHDPVLGTGYFEHRPAELRRSR
jgi:hypothetical protein